METIQKSILDKRPTLGELFDYDGTLLDYFSSITQKKGHSINYNSRFKEFLLLEIKRLYPEQDIKQIDQQLSDHAQFSSADHHGLLNYSLLYNSNILYAELLDQLKLSFSIVLSTGNVSLSNPSYPRGFYFKNKKSNFFPKKFKNWPAFLVDQGINTRQSNDLSDVMLNIKQLNLSGDEKLFFEKLFFDYLDIKTVSQNYPVFSDQISRLNSQLVKLFYHKKIRGKKPSLIYLQKDQIISNVLIDEIKKEHSLIHSLLFDPEIRSIYYHQFKSLPGCWADESGSDFFWAISKSKKINRLNLDHENNLLISNEEKIEINKESLIDALKSDKIIPTLFFDFLIITFLEGNTAWGGFNQIEYVSQMQKAHIKCLNLIGQTEIAELFASRTINNLICGMLPFKWNSAIDLIWQCNSANGKFNGTLDNGILEEELNRHLNTPLKELIQTGLEVMIKNT